jgi:hypothetical protein
MKNPSRRLEKPARRPVPVAVAEPESAPTPDAPETSRVSFAIGPDGKPIVDRMRSSTREALRAAYSDESFLQSIGVRSGEDADDAFLMSIISGGALDLASVLMIMTARRAGYAIEHAKILAFTPAEKQTLVPPASKVIKKYIPSISGKYKDEIMLAIALANVIGAKIVLLRETTAASVQQSGSTVAAATTTEAPDEAIA